MQRASERGVGWPGEFFRSKFVRRNVERGATSNILGEAGGQAARALI